MGGFWIQPPEIDDLPSFPLDAKQLHVLVKEGYIEYPHLEVEEIKDKSKSDGLTRWVTGYLGYNFPFYGSIMLT